MGRWCSRSGRVGLVCALLAGGLLAGESDHASDMARVRSAMAVFHAVLGGPDREVTRSVLSGATCVAIIPGDKNLALGLGGIYGKGVAMCRNNNQWSAPVFIVIGGASFGPQIGVESADIVIAFQQRAGLEALLNDKLRLGASAGGAAGPVGRDAAAATDASMRAEALTWGHSRGLYVGANINGSIVQPDDTGNRAMYGGAYWEDVLAGRVAAPADTAALVGELNASPYTNPVVAARLGVTPAASPASQVGAALSLPAVPLRPFTLSLAADHQSSNNIGLGGFDAFAGFHPLRNSVPSMTLLADFSRLTGSTSLLGLAASERMTTYLAGPQFDVPRHIISPYAQFLLGAGHLSTTTNLSSAGDTSFAWDLGAGLGIHIGRYFSFRLVQFDLLHSDFNHNSATDSRWSIGGALHF